MKSIRSVIIIVCLGLILDGCSLSKIERNTDLNRTNLESDVKSEESIIAYNTYYTDLTKMVASGYNQRITQDGVSTEAYGGYQYMMCEITGAEKIYISSSIADVKYNILAFYMDDSIGKDTLIEVHKLDRVTTKEIKVPTNAKYCAFNFISDNPNYNIKQSLYSGVVYENMTENLFDPNTVYQYENYWRTMYIPVKPMTSYVCSRNSMLIDNYVFHNANQFLWHYYDSNFNEIGTIDSNPFVTPNNCKYIRLTSNSAFSNFKLEEGKSVKGYVPYGKVSDYPQIENSQYRNKLYCAVGDSITAGNSYVQLLAMKTGMVTISVNGVAGSCVAKVDYNNNRTDYFCSDERINEIPIESEIITIMGGTNDYATPIGTLDGEHDECTFYGAYQLMLDKIKKRCPDALIFLCEMPFKKDEYTWKHFKERQNAIRNIANKYGCGFLATSKENVNINNYEAYRIDGTHPNEQGQEIIADVLADEMLQLN